MAIEYMITPDSLHTLALRLEKDGIVGAVAVEMASHEIARLNDEIAKAYEEGRSVGYQDAMRQIQPPDEDAQ